MKIIRTKYADWAVWAGPNSRACICDPSWLDDESMLNPPIVVSQKTGDKLYLIETGAELWIRDDDGLYCIDPPNYVTRDFPKVQKFEE